MFFNIIAKVQHLTVCKYIGESIGNYKHLMAKVLILKFLFFTKKVLASSSEISWDSFLVLLHICFIDKFFGV